VHAAALSPCEIGADEVHPANLARPSRRVDNGQRRETVLLSRPVRVAVVVVLIAAAAALMARAAPAAAAGLTVELTPNSVTTQTGRAAHVLLVLRNSGPDATAVRVSWLDPAPAKVAADDATSVAGERALKPISLSKGQDHAWALTVTTPVGAAASKVLFRVDYMAAKTAHVAAATLDVANATPTTADAVASVDVKTTLSSLDRQHPGVVYLLVTNKLPVSLTIKNVTATGPSYVDFDTPDKPLTIPARQQSPLAIGVDAKDRVREGKYLLLFGAELHWKDGDQDQSARLVTTQETQIGIAGESAVLTLLGVPSFLLIPGFLVVLTVGTFWKVRRPHGAGEFPLEATKPEFWLAAVTLSIAIAFLYPRFGGVDYLSSVYGLRDVIWIWFISLAIGVAVYLAIALWRGGRHDWLTPSADDDPPTVVKKLARQKLELDRPRYDFGADAAGYSGYLIVPRGAAELWLAPQLTVRVKENVVGAAELLADLNAENEPKRLAKTLDRRRHDLRFSWERGAGEDHPYQKSAADLSAAVEQPEEPFVRVG
jgi:hypothetical protein